MSNPIETGVRIRDLRNELRRLEAQNAAELTRLQPLTVEQEVEMSRTQSRLDAAYQAAGRRAPPPEAHERPAAFHKRLLDGLTVYSDDWRGKSFSSINDPNALAAIENQLTESARRHGPGFGLKGAEIRELPSESRGGHKTVEFVGGPEAWFGRYFARPAPRAVLPTHEQAVAASRDNQLARITQVIPRWMRPTVTAPRATF